MAIPWAKGANIQSAKPFVNHFQGWGLNRFFTLASVVAAGATGLSTAAQFMQDANVEDPHTFENLGYGAGAFIGETAFAAGAGFTAWDMWRQQGMPEVVKYKGKIFNQGQMRTGLGGGRGLVEKLPGAKKGVLLGSGKFIKAGSWKRDLLALTLAPIAAGIVSSAGLGMAGKFIDNAISEKKQRDSLNYDDRYFNTQMYDQATYNQVGMAMQGYSERMMSVARIYHSR